jgi:hypothetical protein
MKLPTYQWFGQVLAATGVIISISLLAYEMKLSRDIASADIYQQRVAMDISMLLNRQPTELVYEVYGKLSRGEELNKEETALHVDVVEGWITSKENVFFQHQLGLLDDKEWIVQRFNLKNFLQTHCYWEFYNSNRQGYREDFAAEIDAIYTEIAKVDCILEG